MLPIPRCPRPNPGATYVLPQAAKETLQTWLRYGWREGEVIQMIQMGTA